MPNYTKLFNSIITSTIWSEDDKTRIIWITMLAMSDKNGEVHASIPGLARVSGMSIQEAESSIEKLLSPDVHSRTPDNEGRRIAKIDGGWELLNHAKYRAMASKEDAKAATAERVKRHRSRNAAVTQCNGGVTDGNAALTQERDIAEAEAEADTKKKPVAVAPVVPFDSPEFANAWAEWQQHRKEKRQKLTASTIKRQFAQFQKWGEPKSISAIELAIEKGWTGLFEPKIEASLTSQRDPFDRKPGERVQPRPLWD
jgi:hypothetical protein